MGELKVMIFGQLEDITGTTEVLIPCVDNTTALSEKLYEKYPALQGRKFMIAINQKIVKGNAVISQDAQIALLPPFSGG